jgi:hypothetical protein
MSSCSEKSDINELDLSVDLIKQVGEESSLEEGYFNPWKVYRITKNQMILLQKLDRTIILFVEPQTPDLKITEFQAFHYTDNKYVFRHLFTTLVKDTNMLCSDDFWDICQDPIVEHEHVSKFAIVTEKSGLLEDYMIASLSAVKRDRDFRIEKTLEQYYENNYSIVSVEEALKKSKIFREWPEVILA